ncbi:FAD-binding oxidoreductase [Chloroflexota bacterium]
MALGDEKHKTIYQELVNILGEDYVSDDPSVLETYYRCGLSAALSCKGRAEFIVLPGSTEDVQQIIRLANRYKFPYSTTGSGMRMYTCNAVEGYPYWCFVDPKRMNSYEIDTKNMYAIVQPYVTIGQIQGEAMKYGLHSEIPGSGSQSSMLAHNVAGEVGWTTWRTGSSARNVLGMEWVLPSGDVLRTGSLATGGGYWWAEGPGPDARGILRGLLPHFGTFGIITRVAVKLFPWPSPRVLRTEGVQPEKKAFLPKDRFKAYFASYPSLEKKVDAVRELGKAEICGWVMSYAPYDVQQWQARSREQYWAEYDYWYEHCQHLLAAGIWGYASEKQLEYEEEVFLDIIKETGGTLVPDDVYQKLDELLTPNVIRDTYRSRFLRSGGVVFGGSDFDSLQNILKSIPAQWELLDKFSPPLGDLQHPDKFWPSEFGRYCYPEVDYLRDKSDLYEYEIASKIKQAQIEYQMKESVASGKFYFTKMNVLGPAFSNCHIMLAKLKHALDPNNLANPTRVIDMDEMEKEKVKG